MDAKPFTAIMVSESHWDRAWYVPFQIFRIRLVRLVDRVIETLDRDPAFHSFMLDGQMLPVEDYLEIRPERRADLERLARTGRLLLGPWYALADEYLVSPEALIRNLMIGLRMAREFGPVMREGYVPDAFGHIGQLPQILNGFDINSAVFWRGLGDEGQELGNEFWWQAPDGSRVLAIYLRDGYHNAANLGYPMRWGDTSGMEFDMELAQQRLRAAVDLLKPHARTPYLLLMNGIDHAELEPLVPEILARANRELPDVQIEHGTLPDFVARVRERIGDSSLATFLGEFNRGRDAVILQSVYSTRMYLKQANDRVQTLLEAYAEPLSGWAWALTGDYPAGFLEAAWRKLLKNHPHDDICGCSVDSVHREMMTRFDEAEQIASTIARDSYRVVMRAINRTEQPGVPFILYNPVGWPRTETLEASLLFDWQDPAADDFRLVDAAGQAVPYQVLSRQNFFEMEVLTANRKQEVRVALLVTALPACGYRVYFALPGAQPAAVEAPVEQFANGMENRYLRVEINPDGSLNVLDKASRQEFRQLGYFSDDEDAGDEYDYSHSLQPQNISSLGQAAQIKLVHSGPLQVTYEVSLTLALPESLTGDRLRRADTLVEVPVSSVFSLRYDSRVVDVRTTVDNRARDHRLRVCFPTGLPVNEATADGHFDVVTRPVDLPEVTDWEQAPVPTRHQRHFIDVSTGEVGLAVFNRGLPEYEIVPDRGHNTIAVTLLRCVDMISRSGLLSRPAHAGPPTPAPEGQCQGQHTFEYAIYPHPGDWRAVYRPAYTWHTPAFVRRGNEQEGYVPGQVWAEDSPVDDTTPARLKEVNLDGMLPAEVSFLTLEPELLVLSAVKRSEQGDALIVRFYNPTAEPVRAVLNLFQPVRTAEVVNLNEEPQAALNVDAQGRVELPVKGKQVRTVALRF